MNQKSKKLNRIRPSVGSVIKTRDEPVPVYVEHFPKFNTLRQNVVMFANALEDADGWYLTSQGHGLKLLILPRSQKELIRQCGDDLYISSLRVVRENKLGTALLTELVDDN